MTSLLRDLVDAFFRNLPSYLWSVGVFVATLILSRLAKQAVEHGVKDRIDEEDTQHFLGQMAYWGVFALGTLMALNQLPGVDVTSLLAGLGILGFTIGFALQDIARNFMAGLLILLRRPFSVGDAVEVAGHAGSVLEVTMRDTVIRTWDGVMEIIPNFDVYSNPIVNYSELPLRRRTVAIGLGYGEDMDRARDLILSVIRATEGVLDEPEPELLTEEFGDTTLNMAARFWVNQDTDSLLGVHSNVVDAINDLAEREGIDMPYPTQIVHLEAELPFETPLS